MRKYQIVSFVIVALMISTGCISADYAKISDGNNSHDQVAEMLMKPSVSYRTDVTGSVIQQDFSALPIDTPVTNTPEDESNPDVAINVGGNPVVMFEKNYDLSQNVLGLIVSPDRGATWPEDAYLEWAVEDSYLTDPEITMLSDGIGAVGSYEVPYDVAPNENCFLASDVQDPNTWQFLYWDNTGTSNYILETSSTAAKHDVLCFATISDYDFGDGRFFIDTFSCHWHLYEELEFISGVVFYNTDAEDISQPLSHLTAGAGDKVFFCAEQELTDGRRVIMTYFCNVTETTVYSDWKSSRVAGGRSNCTYPNLAVSGAKAYCVYMDDVNGNQDIYVATTSAGVSWTKYAITNTPEEELYPVITANGDDATCMFTRNNDLYVSKTEDAGKTWSSPEKVNDDAGTVTSGFGNAAIAGAYGLWTGNSGESNDIFFEEVGRFSKVIIDKISGGFGSKTTLSNIGNADAADIPWSIKIEGGLVLAGAETSGTVSIPAGGSKTISAGFIFAFGRVTITVTVGTETKTASGFALGPFLLNVA